MVEPAEEWDEDAPMFRISDASASRGKTFTAEISLENNPGITALSLNVGYPHDVLELKSVAYENLFSSQPTNGRLNADPFILSWCSSSGRDESSDGTLARLTFAVRDDAPDGSCDISLSYDEDNVFNSDFDNVRFRTVNGCVTVRDYISGDVNGDMKVNMKDIALMIAYINKLEDNLCLDAADVTGDGSVNLKDAVLLQQYLNGWEVELK